MAELLKGPARVVKNIIEVEMIFSGIVVKSEVPYWYATSLISQFLLEESDDNNLNKSNCSLEYIPRAFPARPSP